MIIYNLCIGRPEISVDCKLPFIKAHVFGRQFHFVFSFLWSEAPYSDPPVSLTPVQSPLTGWEKPVISF